MYMEDFQSRTVDRTQCYTKGKGSVEGRSAWNSSELQCRAFTCYRHHLWSSAPFAKDTYSVAKVSRGYLLGTERIYKTYFQKSRRKVIFENTFQKVDVKLFLKTLLYIRFQKRTVLDPERKEGTLLSKLACPLSLSRHLERVKNYGKEQELWMS